MNGIKRNLVLPNGATVEWFMKDEPLVTLELTNSANGIVVGIYLRHLDNSVFSGESSTQLFSSSRGVTDEVMCWRFLSLDKLKEKES